MFPLLPPPSPLGSEKRKGKNEHTYPKTNYKIISVSKHADENLRKVIVKKEGMRGGVALPSSTCLVCASPGFHSWPYLPKEEHGRISRRRRRRKKKSFQVEKVSAIAGCFKYNTKIQNSVLSFFPKKCSGLKRKKST